MKRAPFILFCLLLIGLAGCAPPRPGTSGSPFSRTREPGCVPLPQAPTEDPSTRTPTPDPRTPQSADVTVTRTPARSPTPIPFSSVVDLSPDIPPADKTTYIILRCDGSWEEYLAGPNIPMPTSIPLAYGDTIYNVLHPIGSAHHHEPTASLTPTIDLTIILTPSITPYTPPPYPPPKLTITFPPPAYPAPTQITPPTPRTYP